MLRPVCRSKHMTLNRISFIWSLSNLKRQYITVPRCIHDPGDRLPPPTELFVFRFTRFNSVARPGILFGGGGKCSNYAMLLVFACKTWFKKCTRFCLKVIVYQRKLGRSASYTGSGVRGSSFYLPKNDVTDKMCSALSAVDRRGQRLGSHRWPLVGERNTCR